MKIGDTVQWVSGAGGSMRKKQGQIVQIVASGDLPARGWTSLHRGQGVGMSRNHESYVVAVPLKSFGSARYYWPVAKRLRPV